MFHNDRQKLKDLSLNKTWICDMKTKEIESTAETH